MANLVDSSFATDSWPRTTTAPQPSDRPNPSARASKVLHWPSAETAFMVQKPDHVVEWSCRLVPITRADAHSDNRKLWLADDKATSADEHSVVMLMLGPVRPSR